MSYAIGKGRYKNENYPEATRGGISVLQAVLENNVQHIGPTTNESATVVILNALPFTLRPSPVPGAATVDVRGSISIAGTAGDAITFGLVRDHNTLQQQVLITEISALVAHGGGPGVATATVEFLDTSVGVFPPGFIPITEGSTHTYTIFASSTGAAIAGDVDAPASIILEQLPFGFSTTV